MHKIIALVAGLAILALANHSIYSRERLIARVASHCSSSPRSIRVR